MNNLLILGSGQHGHVVKELAELLHIFNKINFLDDNDEIAIGKIDEVEKFKEEYNYCIPAIGNNDFREKLFDRVRSMGYIVPTLIHPSAQISKSALIGEGTIILNNTVINSRSIVENNCIIGLGVIIDHDVVIGKSSHIKPGCIIDSNINIIPKSLFGVGEIVKGGHQCTIH